MDNYSKLLGELHAAQRRRPEPDFDLGEIGIQRRQFAKAIDSVTAGLTRLVPAKRKPVQRAQRQDAGQIMAKAFTAYRDGKISGDQLRQLEARHHIAVDALAQRGAL